MNKNTGYVLRIALGGYLIWLGINILIQVLDARPTNTEFVCAAAVFFMAVGGVYAVYSLVKLLSMQIKLRKKAVSEDESINESAEGTPPVRVQSEKRTHQLTQAVIKLQADTVEFPQIKKAAERQPEKNTKPGKGAQQKKNIQPKNSAPPDRAEIEKTISLRTEEIKEKAEAEEIETDYEEK